MSELKKTPLYDYYQESGVKVIDFSGWALPVQFSSIKEEHTAVREAMGMFEVSHMGEGRHQRNEDCSKFRKDVDIVRNKDVEAKFVKTPFHKN